MTGAYRVRHGCETYQHTHIFQLPSLPCPLLQALRLFLLHERHPPDDTLSSSCACVVNASLPEPLIRMAADGL